MFNIPFSHQQCYFSFLHSAISSAIFLFSIQPSAVPFFFSPFSHQQCLIFFSAKVSIIFQTSKRFLILSLLYEVYSPSFAAFVIFLLSLPRKSKHRNIKITK